MSNSESSEIEEEISQNGLDYLFDSLKGALELDRPLNYRSDGTKTEKCIGEFLSHIPGSKKDIDSAIKAQFYYKKWNESIKRRFSKKSFDVELKKKKFSDMVDSLLEKGRLSAKARSRIVKSKYEQILDSVKDWMLGSISQLEKEKAKVKQIISMDSREVERKKVSLEEEYVWKRFTMMVESIAFRNSNVKEISAFPNSEIKKDIEENLKMQILLKKGIIFQCNDFSAKIKNGVLAYTNEREGNSLLEALTSMQQPKEEFSEISYPNEQIISRCCISYLGSSEFKPLSLLIYTSTAQNFSAEFKEIAEEGIIGYEEEVKSSITSTTSISNLKFSEEIVSFSSKSTKWVLSIAKLSDLKSDHNLYVFDIPKYNMNDQNIYYVRPLNQREIIELKKAYLIPHSCLSLTLDIFPEMDIKNFKYIYSLVNWNTGNGTKYLFVQLDKKESPNSPNKEIIEPICKYEGCIAPIIKFSKIMNTRKTNRVRESSSKKQLNERSRKSLQIRKKKSEDPIPQLLFCEFHQKMKNSLKLQLPFTIDAGPELWKAIQGGINWRDNLIPNSRLWTFIDCAKEDIEDYFTQVANSLSVPSSSNSLSSQLRDSPEMFFTYKQKLTKEIEELKKRRDIEVAITDEIRKCVIADSSSGLAFGSNSAQFYADLKDAQNLEPSLKLTKIKTIREKYENLLANSKFETRPNSQRSSRPFSAFLKGNERRNTACEPIMDMKEINQKMMSSPYYASQIRLGNIAKRVRLPKPANTVNKAKSMTALERSKLDLKFL
ncbi:unnamed protein product [Blepharisma stoltei]|uniref:Uncharacterized protein n=1 Tax=Blepharisma stoltei TaxID=1481888 RepID=A0AAU9JL84_9CILI|nr:unnamed protein product [Blepharisma stoltei]